MKLLMILLGLAVALVIVVSIAQRYSKPMSGESQKRLSRIIMFLVPALIIVQMILYWVRNG